jgi:O-antigen/teichoic acid export membrane protein
MRRLRRVATPGPAALLAAAIVASISNFAFHAVGSRLLGPTDYSSLAAILAMLVVVAVPIGAVQTAVTQASAGASDASASPTIERTARAGFVLILVGIVCAFPLDRVLSLHNPWAVALTAAWAAVACLGAVGKGALLGRLRYGPVAVALIVGAVARVGAGLLLVPFFHVEGAMLATLIGEILATAVVIASLRNGLLSLRAPALRPRGTDATVALAAQLGLWLLAGATTIVGRRVLPADQAGNFAAASTITNAAMFLPLAVATAFFPKFTRDRSRRSLSVALGVALVLGGIAAGIVAVAPTASVRLLAGPSFAADPAVVAMLAIASMLVGCAGVAMFYLLSCRRPSSLSVWLGASVACVCALVAHDARTLAFVALGSAALSAVALLRAAYRATAIDDIALMDIRLPDAECMLTVVVPSYNGGETLRPTVDALWSSLRATGWSYEIVVEIDGSDDGSPDTLQGCPPEVVVEISAVNEGKGAALRRGFARARGAYIGFVDGDGDIDVDIVRRLARACKRPGVWAAIASKRAEGSDVSMSFVRSTLSRGYRHLVALLFGLDVTDTQCGAKVFSRGGLERALPWARSDGFALDVELLGLGRRLALGAVVELPVKLNRETRSTSMSPQIVLRMLEETLRVWGNVLDAPVVLTVPETGVTIPASDLVAAEQS